MNCLEVCVEDPSDEFQALRDHLDLKLFTKYMKEHPEVKLEWNEKFWQDVRKELKLNKAQIRRCYEIYKLEKISTTQSSNYDEGNSLKKIIQLSRNEKISIRN